MGSAIADSRPEDGTRTDDAGPARRRRRIVTGPTMCVLALVTCAVGFYGGVRVEKSNASSSSTATNHFAVAAVGGATGRSSASRRRFSGGSTPTSGGFSPGAGAGGVAGTVSSVNGRTIVLSETGGNSVKVKLTSATTIRKTKTVGYGSVHPGDSITVTGSHSHGTISAASVTDSGDSSTSTSSSSTGSSSSGSSSGGVSSLFGG